MSSPEGSSVTFRRVPPTLRRAPIQRFAGTLQKEVVRNRSFDILITGDAELRRLNRDFRGKDYPTDVLSFPADKCGAGWQPAADWQSASRACSAIPGQEVYPVTLKDQIIAAFKKVYDPEMPVNIYELGLIYGVDVDDAGQVAIRMTLTAPNCPVAGSLPAEVERAARAVPGVTGVKLELTFDPPWTKARMSEAAKLALGIEDIIPISRLRR